MTVTIKITGIKARLLQTDDDPENRKAARNDADSLLHSRFKGNRKGYVIMKN